MAIVVVIALVVIALLPALMVALALSVPGPHHDRPSGV